MNNDPCPLCDGEGCEVCNQTGLRWPDADSQGKLNAIGRSLCEEVKSWSEELKSYVT